CTFNLSTAGADQVNLSLNPLRLGLSSHQHHAEAQACFALANLIRAEPEMNKVCPESAIGGLCYAYLPSGEPDYSDRQLNGKFCSRSQFIACRNASGPGFLTQDPL